MSTSKLQRKVSEYLSIHFGRYTIRENTRPEWLIMPTSARLELDFLLEEISLAIEVQGRQHYCYTPYFHGSYGDFQERLARDQFKREQCQAKGITLVEIASDDDIAYLLDPLIPRKGSLDPFPLGPVVIYHFDPEEEIAKGWRSLIRLRHDLASEFVDSTPERKLAAIDLLIKACERLERWGTQAKLRRKKKAVVTTLPQLYNRRARLLKKIARGAIDA